MTSVNLHLPLQDTANESSSTLHFEESRNFSTLHSEKFIFGSGDASDKNVNFASTLLPQNGTSSTLPSIDCEEKKDIADVEKPILQIPEGVFEKIRFIGQVKWFNTKAGYGFITVRGNNIGDISQENLNDLRLLSVDEEPTTIDCKTNILKTSFDTKKDLLEDNKLPVKISIENALNMLKGKDIFVHYSSIDAVKAQYKFLVQGEYVEFNILTINGGKYEYHSANVSGINGGTIMCETKNTNLSIQQKYTGKNMTYVDKSGVRHYSKFRTPRANNNFSVTNMNQNTSSPTLSSGENVNSSSIRPEEYINADSSNKNISKPLLSRSKNNISKLNTETNNLQSQATAILPSYTFASTSFPQNSINKNMNEIVFSKENNYCTPPLNALINIKDDSKGEYKTVSRGRNKQKKFNILVEASM